MLLPIRLLESRFCFSRVGGWTTKKSTGSVRSAGQGSMMGGSASLLLVSVVLFVVQTPLRNCDERSQTLAS